MTPFEQLTEQTSTTKELVRRVFGELTISSVELYVKKLRDVHAELIKRFGAADISVEIMQLEITRALKLKALLKLREIAP